MYLFWKLILSILLSVPMVAGQVVFMSQNDFQPLEGQAPSLPVNIGSLFNNRAFGKRPNDADFDGSGSLSTLLRPLRVKYE
jgi:alpha-L-fucosidase